MAKDVQDFGPLMMALPEKERMFVINLFEYDNAAQAAREAGFGTVDSTAIVMANIGRRLRCRERVIEAMGEYAKALLRSEGPGAISTVREVMGDRKEPVARLRAANMILERIDPVSTKVDVTHTHKFDPVKVTLDFLFELKKQGWSREQLLTEFSEFELAHFEGLLTKREQPAIIDMTPLPEVDPELAEPLKV